MRTIEQNWTNTLTATSAALTNRKTTRQDRAAFCERVEILTEPLTLIDEQWQLAEPASGDANAKDAARQALGLAVSELIGAMLIYAAKTVNPEIAAQVAFSPMEIIGGKATELVVRCRAIHATATTLAENLAPYGISATKLSNVKKMIDSFDGPKSAPRPSRVECFEEYFAARMVADARAAVRGIENLCQPTAPPPAIPSASVAA